MKLFKFIQHFIVSIIWNNLSQLHHNKKKTTQSHITPQLSKFSSQERKTKLQKLNMKTYWQA